MDDIEEHMLIELFAQSYITVGVTMLAQWWFLSFFCDFSSITEPLKYSPSRCFPYTCAYHTRTGYDAPLCLGRSIKLLLPIVSAYYSFSYLSNSSYMLRVEVSLGTSDEDVVDWDVD